MSDSNQIPATPRKIDSLDRIEGHVVIIAVLNIVAASFYLMSAAMILYNIFFTNFNSSNRDFALTLSVAMILISLPYLLVGIGLLLRIRLARFGAVLLGFVHLLEIPVGTPLGFYTLWLFLQNNTDEYFDKHAAPDLRIYSEDD